MVRLSAQCTRNNAELGITGALYYSEETFFQVIEGAEPPVWELMDRIKADPRHKAPVIIEQLDIPSRLFRYWRMKFVSPRMLGPLCTNFDYDRLRRHSPGECERRIQELYFA